MTTLVRAGVIKELRALLVPWLLILSAVVIAGLTEDVLVVPVAVVGAVSLGAWAVGHEYSYRTLALLLSQPIDRRTMVLAKAVCLAPLVFVICATAAMFTMPGRSAATTAVAFAGALSFAPWLTMVSRSTRGGILFTLALGLFWTMVGIRTGEAIAIREPGRWADPLMFAEYFLYTGFAVICCAAGVLGWRRFQSLSALDERTEHLTVPAFWLGRQRALASPARVRHPHVALLRKELGLQVPVLILSSVYMLAWAGSWLLRPGARDTLLMVVTMLHGGLVPLLAGALASAEERRLGTHATQLLQPVSAHVQWTIKAVVVIGLAVVLAVGLPVVLDLFDPAVLSERGVRRLEFRWFPYLASRMPVIAVVGMLAGFSLYASSLVRNSLHAFLASIAAAAGLSVGLDAGLRLWPWLSVHNAAVTEVLMERRELFRTPEVWGAYSLYAQDIMQAHRILNLGAAFVLVVGGLWLFVRFGNENHRFDDHQPWRVGVQAIAILFVPVVALALLGALPAWILGS